MAERIAGLMSAVAPKAAVERTSVDVAIRARSQTVSRCSKVSATVYSITSSARASSVGAKSRPSSLGGLRG